MLKKLKALFTDASHEEPTRKKHDISLAITALMVEIMYIDGKLDAAESQTIFEAVSRRFSLAKNEVDVLIEEAKIAHETATDFHQYTSLIAAHYSTEERIDFLSELWQIAMADGHIDAYEEQLIRRLANLLGVYHAEFIQAKQQARQA